MAPLLCRLRPFLRVLRWCSFALGIAHSFGFAVGPPTCEVHYPAARCPESAIQSRPCAAVEAPPFRADSESLFWQRNALHPIGARYEVFRSRARISLRGS